LYKWESSGLTTKIISPDKEFNYTILIPVRNEEKFILSCLNSILNNTSFDLNKIEIIVIDDHSEDNTPEIIKNLNNPKIKLLSLRDNFRSNLKFKNINAFKKAALNLGLSNAKGDYIIQLDGDVIVPETYLKTINEFVSKYKPKFLAAPVIFKSNKTTFQDFQVLDFLGMMIVTQVGIVSKLWYLANGANMIYKKNAIVFDSEGYASGDDVFGIQSVAELYKDDIYFLKSNDACVSTYPTETIKDFIYQRLRWATKNKTMNYRLLIIMAIPFLNIIFIPIHFISMYYFGVIAFVIFLSHLTIKMMIDYIYLSTASKFFQKTSIMKNFIPSFFLHLLYIGIIGSLSLFVKRYSWKGRKVF